MSSDPDTLPSTTDPGGRCSRCGRVSNFAIEATFATIRNSSNVPTERVAVLRCMGCAKGTVVLEALVHGQWVPIHWWPLDGGETLDQAVPSNVASCYDEGMRALSVHAARAAVVMFRAALAEIVSILGSAQAQGRNTLYEQLAQMEQEGTLHPHLVEWAKEIRLLGNIGAHPNSLGAVSDEDAAELGRLTKQLIEVLFEVPARITRARASRVAPAAPAASATT